MSSPQNIASSSSTAMEPQPLPPVRRFITGHDSSGKAVWDATLAAEVPGRRTGGFTMHTSWVNQNATADVDGDRDLQSYLAHPVEADVAPASGSVVRVVDFWPGYPAVLHRTASVDYGVVLEGEIDCVLDDGATRTLTRGDIVIQRGTLHAWRNRGNAVARVCFTLLPAPPVKTSDGTELEVHHLADFPRLAEKYTV